MSVVVTRPGREAVAWVEALRQRGFDALALPLIEIRPPEAGDALAAARDHADEYRAVMFVSANAVRGFFGGDGGRDWPSATRAWAPGPGTRDALLAAGVPAARIDAPPDESAQFDSEALWQVVRDQCHPGDRVLLVRGGDGRNWLEEALAGKDVAVDRVHSYSRVRPTWTAAELALARQAQRDCWLFSSSEAIANLSVLAPRQDWRRAQAVATHPRIASAARAAGFGVVRESRPGLDDVIAALESLG